MEQKIGYFSKQVALKLDINASTLRQWCLAMEEEEYEFERNDKGQRIFYEHDINALFEVKTQIEKTRNRDTAIKSVVSRKKLENDTEITPSVHENEPEIITFTKEELEDLIESTVKKTVEEMTEQFQDKMQTIIESAVEMKTRTMLLEMQKANELKPKELEMKIEEKIAEVSAAQQKQSILQKWFGSKKQKRQG